MVSYLGQRAIPAIYIVFPENPVYMDGIVLELAQRLLELFGGDICSVERIDGWDGSNVRIVVRNIDIEDRIIDAIVEFEEERGILGTILPEIVVDTYGLRT